MPIRSAAVACAVLLTAGCANADVRPASGDAPSRATAGATDHVGTLSRRERALATVVATRQQHRVDGGTFVGATAFANGPGHSLTIRLVWEAGRLMHSGLARPTPADGPRVAMFLTYDEKSGQTRVNGVKYRDVGAGRDETLLYGAWPSPAES